MTIRTKMKLSTKIILLGLSVAILMGAMYVYLIPYFSQRLHAEKQLKTRHIVEAAVSLLEHYVTLEKTGVLTRENAQSQAKKAVGAMRYEVTGYFWINDFRPVTLMHPTKDLIGQDMSDLQDETGKYIFKEFVKVAKNQGAGFVDYYWPKPGESVPVPKLSYVQQIPHWEWIVGTGIYVDDVDKEVRRLSFLIIGVVVAVSILSVLTSPSVPMIVRHLPPLKLV